MTSGRTETFCTANRPTSSCSLPATALTPAELELCGPGVVDQRARDVARHEVGRELHPGHLQRHGLRDRPYQQGLRHAGDTFEEYVAAAQQGNDESCHGGVLTDDGLAD